MVSVNHNSFVKLRCATGKYFVKEVFVFGVIISIGYGVVTLYGFLLAFIGEKVSKYVLCKLVRASDSHFSSIC